MKYFFVLLAFVALVFQGCDLREREDALVKKETLLNQKEQELLLKETKLQLKEEELARREQAIDSTRRIDSTAIINPALMGTWDVKMTCTETSCPGSAVGDTKTETWVITYQNKSVIARAMVNNELVRVYSGFFTGNTLELVDNHQPVPNQPDTRIVVRLREAKANQLEGTREIERTGVCKIIYETILTKKTVKP